MRARGVTSRLLAWLAAGTAVSSSVLTHQAIAQPGSQLNPVYVDDSPSASDTLVRVRELLAAGNSDEAVRVLQLLLDEQGDRVIASPSDPDVFVSVRSRVNTQIKSSPELLKAYARLVSPRAEAALREGQPALVERTMLLTPAGFESALRLGQRLIEDARFEAARIMLEQLVDHPDAAGGNAKRLAELYGLLPRYIDRPVVRTRAAELATRGEIAASPAQPVPWPAAATDRGRSLLDPLPALRVPELISKPLWTAPLGVMSAPQDPSNPVPGVRGNAAQIPPFARELTILPTAQGDWVFVNDGMTISTWDRFTLTPRWSYSPNVMDAPGAAQEEIPLRGGGLLRARVTGTQRNEDASVVSISGRTLVASIGRGAGRDGDDRVVAVDIPTGRALWTSVVRTLDPMVTDGLVRGPVLLDEGTAVVAIRKYVPDRRLMSLALAGLDLRSGATRWVRAVASTGQMPWLGPPGGSDAMLGIDGIVYRADRLGVIAAIEADSGRVVWIRRSTVETGATQVDAMAWHLNAPVADGDSIVLITPDSKRIERLSRATGAVLASRDAKQLGDPVPRYLLRAGNRLACVDDARVRFVDLANFDKAEVTGGRVIAEQGIRGRVSLAGGKLLAPTTSGVVVIDPAKAQADGHLIGLEETGNVLALDNQLVVVDDSRLHSYLLWEVAEGLLTERMRADPGNPSPAVTFAELAYRAGKPEKIGPAVDAAMTALRGSSAGESAHLTRQRLFDALHTMLNHAVEQEAAGGGGSGRRPLAGVRPLTDETLLRTLAVRLGELARSPDERLAYTLAWGRLAERASNPGEAAGQYQAVLDDPALVAATWRGPAALVRGELEAARRIEMLIARHGAGVYAAQEQRALADLGALGPAPTGDQLEHLAMRYPLSSMAPALWLRIASLERAAERPNRAASALDAGLRVAQRVGAPDPRVVGELAGQLITELRRRGQVLGAANILRAVRGRFPQVTLTAMGAALDAERLGAELADRLAATMRWARVGELRPEGAQAMPGWTIMQPILRDAGPVLSTMLALERDDEIGVWSAPTAQARDEDAQLVRTWNAKLEGREGRLIKTTPDAAYFLLSDGQGEAAVHKVAIGEGKTRWVSEPTSKLFAADDARALQRAPGAVADAFYMPAGGQATPRDLVIAMDDRTIAVVQRGGRAAGIDAETGETLWTIRTLVSRVYDADLVGGVLAVAGDQEVLGAGGGAIELRPNVQTIEARTGHALQRVGDLEGHPRWIKLADNGAAVIGLDQTVACVDLGTAQVNWRMAGPDNQPIDAAWVFGDQAVLLAPTRNLYLATISSGRVHPQPLEVPKTHTERARSLEVFPLTPASNSGFGISTNQGLVLFTGEGELAGIDGLGGEDSMLPPKPADGRATTIQTMSDGRAGDGLLLFQSRQFETSTAALLDTRGVQLGARPADMLVMDNRVAITAGNVTVVLSAPAKK